ncbi:MAG: glycoside hydrolase family 3 C-terminal domain-containing protein [Mycobacteriales bacterium]
MRRLARVLAVPFALSAGLAGLAVAPATGATAAPPATPDQRAAALVAQMTLDEKITELHGIQDSQHRRYVPGIPRLGIPPLRITNGPAGAGPGDDPTQPPATALPAPIALAASFDPGLADAYGRVQGSEVRDLAHGLLEAPDINIARIPQNGRTFEGYGEDPYLVGRISAADIRGIQREGIIAEVKHFAANNQEANRFAVNEIIDERTLHEIYFPAFEASVKQGHSASVMCAYPKVNGLFACENPYLLQTVLRDEWGFTGFVQSDFGATHSTAPSALAGEDLEMPTGKFFDDAMRQAVADGSVPIAVIDRMLVRRFAVEIRFGLLDRPQTTTPIPVQADGAFALSAAEQSTVLLKNAGGQLPLRASALHSVAVVGPYAGAARTGGGGSSHVVPAYTVDPVTGLKNRLGPGVAVSTADGSDIGAAAALAGAADVAVVMVGDNETEGHDRTSLALDGTQDQLVAAVAAANPHTVVVVKSGAPVLMPWLDQVPAVVEAWYPGEEDGDAVAAVLLGDVNPAGKLPISFPRAAGDVPAHTPEQYPGVNGVATYSEGLAVGYRWYDQQNIDPLFPFGFGLSYTTFRFSDLTVTRPDRHGRVRVGLDVTNTGRRTGAEVAQVYVSSPAAAGEPPRQLRGFQKVTLRPGQTRHLQLTLDARSFQTWNATSHTWTTIPGTYTIAAGDSSRSLPLHAPVRIH